MKYAILLLIGSLPLPLGYLVAHLLAEVWLVRVPGDALTFIGLGILAVWFTASLLSAKFFASKRKPPLFLNAFAALAIALCIFKFHVVPGIMFDASPWAVHFLMSAQTFYLPLIRLSSGLLNVLPRFVLPVVHSTLLFVFGFALLVLSSYLGVRMGKRRERNR